ncbi:MAG: type II toxin-antitoxin system ParD family antitoxin [Pirellulales bacterium]
MSFEVPADIVKLIEHHMALGGYSSPDEVLRDALEALSQFGHDASDRDREYDETVTAVREGLADVEAGRMRPLRDLIEENRGQQKP